jgi:hypothetical protein
MFEGGSDHEHVETRFLQVMRFVEHELGSLSPVTVDSGRAKIV